MLTYVLIVLVVMACVGVYLDRALNDFLIDHLANTLKREAQLAATIWEPSSEVDPVEVDRVADMVGERLDLRATIIAGDGVVLGDSRVATINLGSLENHADRPEFIEAQRGEVGQSLRFSATLGQEMLYVAQLLRRNGDGRTVLRLAMPLHEVQVLEGSITTVIWIGSTIGLLIAVVLAYGVSRFESRPIEQMIQGARQMAAAVPGAEASIPTATTRELDELSAALKEMYGQLQERMSLVTTEKVRLEAILESISEGIMVTGRDGRVVLVNQALMRIFAIEQPAVGYLPIELIRNAQVAETVEAVLENDEEVSHELTLAGGPERHLDVHIGPVRREEECIGVVAVFYDITPLRHLERVRKDFVANVSHELRTPLTAIKGYAETLSEGALDNRQSAERFVRILESHADRLTHLLDDLLDLSRLESENLELERGRCRLRGLAAAAAAPVSQLARQKRIDIRVEVEPSLEVDVDGKLIEQALINLVDNAVKYTNEGGTAKISARPVEANGPPAKVAVEVSDTGIGIPAEDLVRVFERFYRVDKGRSRAQGGTGLGLSIVRHIVESHGEKVYVDSELGRGTTFGFTLPVASA